MLKSNQKSRIPIFAMSTLLLGQFLVSSVQGQEPIKGAVIVSPVWEGEDINGVTVIVTILNDRTVSLTAAALTIRDPLLPDDFALTLPLGSIPSGEQASATGFLLVSSQTYADWPAGLGPLAEISYTNSPSASQTLRANLTYMPLETEEE